MFKNMCIYLLGFCLGNFSLLHAQWQTVPAPSDRLFAFVESSPNTIFAGSENTGLWRSTNGGASFHNYPTGIPGMSYDILSFERSRDTLWAGIYGGGVALSANGGNGWVSFNNGFQTQAMVVSVKKFADTLYAAVDFAIGLQSSGVYKTAVQQDNWVYSGINFPLNLSIVAFEITPAGVLVVGAGLAGSRGNVQISMDGGHTWLNRNIAGVQSVLSLALDGETVYAGTTDGIFVTDNYGLNWKRFGAAFQGQVVDDLLIYNGKLFAAVDSAGVVFGDFDDANWNVLTGNLPLAGDYVSAIFVYNNQIFASLSAANGVWRRELPITGIDDPQVLPGSLVLYQNYPNPFNPATTIAFRLTEPQPVTLKIFDLSGREVAVLIDSKLMSSGDHAIRFEPRGLASGLYVYMLKAGAFTTSNKMLLLK